jgi:hypothetical protein
VAIDVARMLVLGADELARRTARRGPASTPSAGSSEARRA